MSQKVSRKGMSEEKEKRQTDSPAKDVKKKMATDKEKQVTDKTDKPEKQVEKPEKQTDKKQVEKSENKPDKSTEKIMDKKEKTTEKRDTQGEKSKEDGAKEEKNPKNDPQEEKVQPQQNGTAIVYNGLAEVTNGTASGPNGTVSGDSDDDDVTLVIDDEPDQDEMFPELTYDDNSDTEGFEYPATDSAPSRSLTRRSQVKATRTPETPRPASEKQTDKDSDADPKDSKVLKLKEEAPPTSDRKLRSSDSPKPQDVKKSLEPIKKQEKSHETVTGREQDKAEQDNSEQEVKEQTAVTQTNEEAVVKVVEIVEESKNNEKNATGKSRDELVEVEVIVEVEPDVEEEKEEPRKVDTNYSKSRVKVSPYRRSSRIADQTASSMLANYTGNNTTMEMDITETSFTSEREGSPTPEDSSYLRGLRTIRARNSYKKLAHVSLTNLANRSARSLLNTSGCESRPTAPVVGRKRRPDADRELPEQHHHHHQSHQAATGGIKRMRLLDRIAQPFRRNLPHALPTISPEIVGINTDLPLTAPVASADTFDPETMKSTPLPVPPGPGASAVPPPLGPVEPLATPLGAHHHADNKRCSIM